MTTSTPSLQPGARDDFDTGPLSWVIGEIREALNRSRAALHEALSQDADAQSTTRRLAKSHLHQAHGALQIVDVDGIALITETVEDLLDRVDAGQLAFDAALVDAIGNAYQALLEYLDELLSGVPHQPVRLFPYYRALLLARGADRIHPADLFFPNLAIRPRLPGADAVGDVNPARYASLRQRFERALLPFLKSAERQAELAHAALMRDIVGEIESLQSSQQVRAFWWVMHGLAEAVAAGQVPNEIYVKQLFARINLQIRRLAQGSSSIAERLLRDALFFIARIEAPSPRAQQIRTVYELDGLVPADYNARRYGQVDVDALAQAKERLAQAKTIWNRLAGGDAGVADSFEHEMHMLADAGSRLNAPPLSRLLRELKGIARHAAHAKPGDVLAVEMATSLLFVENALNHIGRLSDDFADRAGALTARLLAVVAGDSPAQSAPWLDDMSREAQQRQTLAALAGEMQANLRQVEKTLDEYFRDPSQQAALEQLDPVLHQIEGALAVLDKGDAVRATRHTREAVQRFLGKEEDEAPEPQELQQLAQNVGALSFFIETLQHPAGNAREQFSFDAEQGVFRARLLERNAAQRDDAALDRELPDTGLTVTVEDELAARQQQSAELALSLSAQPDNPVLQQQLRQSLEQIRLDAALIDNPEANDRAQAGIALLESEDFTASPQALAEIVTSPVAAESVPLPPVVAPDSDEAIDAELLEIFIAEADEVLATVTQTLPESRNQPHNMEHLTTLRRSFHTLKGSSRMVGLAAFGEAAWSIEQALNLRLAESRDGDHELYALIEKAAEVLDGWVEDLKAQRRFRSTPDALIAAAGRVKDGQPFTFDDAPQPAAEDTQAEQLPVALPEAEEVPMSDADLALFNTPAPSMSADVIEFPAMRSAESASDAVKHIGELEISMPLYNIYLAETDSLVRTLANDFAEWRHEPEREVNTQAIHAAHSLAGSSATIGFTSLQEVAHALEMVLQTLARNPVRLRQHEFDALGQSVEWLRAMLQKFALGELPAHQPEYARVLLSICSDIEAREHEQHAAAAAPAAAAGNEMAGHDEETPVLDSRSDAAALLPPLQDELDADLLPVFFEEGRDLLPQMDMALREWLQKPADAALPQSLLRWLHTLKGSARMAGAMALGQHWHDMETRIEDLMHVGEATVPLLEELLQRHDHGMQMFEQLQNPVPAQQQAPALPVVQLQDDAMLPPTPAMPEAALPVQAGAAPLVRVRADILDRLVNQAGEVSIARSKLETDVGSLKQALSELTENVGRLRNQLREIEMQAETQIASQMGLSARREFDPLEFDRFTRLQELTRMMAESVDDVGSVHHNLARTLDNASNDLNTQARLTRDLQQDLMRVRMVQFAGIAERLFRVTRQAAKETGKRVNLDIRGGSVELDRGVLEKMTAPFEHLLRNAVAHGIEAREERRAAGKNETGELLIEVRQDGNEIVIDFSDDGQGLNLARIRDKAMRNGLLEQASDKSDDEVRDLIFHPGFSTAEEITELAGRGVGMDVVRSEAAALGGRIAIRSETGKGAQFTIHLPLTLAVTQVVLLSAGGNTYAVPSALVEQVQQLKTTELAAAYNDGSVAWQGQRVPLHYLSALLGDRKVSPVAQNYSPLLILKSGNERVALHVDEILGNREVVVKNIGPQLARMVGMAGATVLGSGDIVLILNPVPLAQRAAPESLRMPAPLLGAVAETAGPVQGLRTQNIVMVVDDSLTVRRVTQRLLTREGYQVVLAKDGVDALEHLQSITPDVMLVDIEMPRMDGFDLTRNVRADERTRHIPIVIITSRTAAKHRNYALELGVNEYLGKPYQEEHLLNLIAGFVKKETSVS